MKIITREKTMLTASITNEQAKLVISEVSIATALLYYSSLMVI